MDGQFPPCTLVSDEMLEVWFGLLLRNDIIKSISVELPLNANVLSFHLKIGNPLTKDINLNDFNKFSNLLFGQTPEKIVLFGGGRKEAILSSFSIR